MKDLPPSRQSPTVIMSWRQLCKSRSSRKIDSQILFSRELDFQKTLSLTENQFSGKTYLHTIRPCRRPARTRTPPSCPRRACASRTRSRWILTRCRRNPSLPPRAASVQCRKVRRRRCVMCRIGLQRFRESELPGVDSFPKRSRSLTPGSALRYKGGCVI